MEKQTITYLKARELLFRDKSPSVKVAEGILSQYRVIGSSGSVLTKPRMFYAASHSAIKRQDRTRIRSVPFEKNAYSTSEKLLKIIIESEIDTRDKIQFMIRLFSH